MLFVAGSMLFFGSVVMASEDAGNADKEKGERAVYVESYLTPSNLSGNAYTYYTFKVSTNVGGTSSFLFDPGDGSTPRRENGTNSRNYSHQYKTNSLKTYTTKGQVTSFDYGPGAPTYGKATISY